MAPVKIVKPEVVYYRLVRNFWNGKALVPAGSVYPFPRGGQPRGSVEVPATEEEVIEAPTAPPSSDLD